MWNIIIALAFQLVSYLLAPKPEPPKTAGLADFDVPVVKEGTSIPRVYGNVWLKAPRIVWYGDFKTKPIKTKQGKK